MLRPSKRCENPKFWSVGTTCELKGILNATVWNMGARFQTHCGLACLCGWILCSDQSINPRSKMTISLVRCSWFLCLRTCQTMSGFLISCATAWTGTGSDMLVAIHCVSIAMNTEFTWVGLALGSRFSLPKMPAVTCPWKLRSFTMKVTYEIAFFVSKKFCTVIPYEIDGGN